jgi:hypothetical protein
VSSAVVFVALKVEEDLPVAVDSYCEELKRRSPCPQRIGRGTAIKNLLREHLMKPRRTKRGV